MKCETCGKEYFIKEEYGLNDSDEFTSKEIGHSPDCDFYKIDPNNRKYIHLTN